MDMLHRKINNVKLIFASIAFKPHQNIDSIIVLMSTIHLVLNSLDTINFSNTYCHTLSISKV